MNWVSILKDEKGEVVDIITRQGKVFVTIRFADGEKVFSGNESEVGMGLARRPKWVPHMREFMGRDNYSVGFDQNKGEKNE